MAVSLQQMPIYFGWVYLFSFIIERRIRSHCWRKRSRSTRGDIPEFDWENWGKQLYLSQESPWLCRDFNRAPPKYEWRAFSSMLYYIWSYCQRCLLTSVCAYDMSISYQYPCNMHSQRTSALQLVWVVWVVCRRFTSCGYLCPCPEWKFLEYP